MNLGEAAAAFRAMAARCEETMALEACEEGAKDYLAILRIVTPKRSGALAESEHIDAVFGGGLRATAVVAPHIRYAAFREYGGTISAKDGEVWKTVNGKSRMYRHTLHWDGGGFPLHVTQQGAHYMEKARGPGAAAVAQACAMVAARMITL